MSAKSKTQATPEPRLFTYDEVAEILGITAWHVRNMVREGRIGYVKTGEHRGRRISRAQVDEYIARNTVQASA